MNPLSLLHRRQKREGDPSSKGTSTKKAITVGSLSFTSLRLPKIKLPLVVRVALKRGELRLDEPSGEKIHEPRRFASFCKPRVMLQTRDGTTPMIFVGGIAQTSFPFQILARHFHNQLGCWCKLRSLHTPDPQDLFHVRVSHWKQLLRQDMLDAKNETGKLPHVVSVSTGGLVSVLVADEYQKSNNGSPLCERISTTGLPLKVYDLGQKVALNWAEDAYQRDPEHPIWKRLLAKVPFEGDINASIDERRNPSFRWIPVVTLIQMKQMMKPCEEVLSRTTTPILMKYGSLDPLADFDYTYSKIRSWKNPNLTYREIPDGKHMAMLGRSSEVFTRIVSMWLHPDKYDPEKQGHEQIAPAPESVRYCISEEVEQPMLGELGGIIPAT